VQSLCTDTASGDSAESRAALHAAIDAAKAIHVPDSVKASLLEIIQQLQQLNSSVHSPSLSEGIVRTEVLLSDRTFLVKALKALQAHALLCGRTIVIADDLAVLRFVYLCLN
jgi:hypothetical protein